MVGVNAGGQLNIFVFEVGYVIDDEEARALGQDVVTACVHPMLVAPESIRYTDTSRAAISQTLGSSVLTHGGKGLRTVQFQGTFGFEPRAFGLYVGNGAVRARRFYDEVVRLSEALNADDVRAAQNALTQSVFLRLNLARYNPTTCAFFVNFYDFLHDRAFQASLQNFGTTRSQSRGGAAGLLWYDLALQEVGPLVRGGIGEDALSVLLDGLSTWRDLTDALDSAAVETLLDGVLGPASVALTQLTASMDEIAERADDVREIFGTSSSGTSNVSSGAAYLDALDRTEGAAEELGAALSRRRADETSAVAWLDLYTASDATRLGPGPARLQQLEAVWDAADVARQLARIGRLFGLDDETFRQLVAAGGESGADGLVGPDRAGSIQHTVEPWDKPQDLETLYGVTFEQICTANNLDPLEALLPGTVLEVPILRTRGSLALSGSPVLGAQTGEDAFGRDLDYLLEASPTGDLLVVTGARALAQGVHVVVVERSSDLLRDLQVVPTAAQTGYIAKRLVGDVLLDPRIADASATVTRGATGNGYDVALALRTVTEVDVPLDVELST